MERSETIMHLHFPLSCLFTKETSDISAVPTNHLPSLLRFAALLLLCLLQAGEPMDPGRRRAHLRRGPAALLGSPSAADGSIPFLPSSCLCISHMGLHLLPPFPQPTAPGGISHQPSPILGDVLKLGSSGRKQGDQGTHWVRARHGLQQYQTSQGNAQQSVSFLQLQDPLTKAVSDSALTRIFVFFPAWITIQSKPHANCSLRVPSPLCASGLNHSHLHLHLFLCCLCGAVVSASSLHAHLSPTPSLSYTHFEMKLTKY